MRRAASAPPLQYALGLRESFEPLDLICAGGIRFAGPPLLL